MSYLYETHSHTSEASACGRVSGSDYIDFMKYKGYQGMIITDHFFNGNSAINRSLPWEERVPLYADGYKRAKAASKGKDFDVMFGIEYNFNGDEYLIYGVDEKWLLENSDIMTLGREDVYKRVHEADGIMVQAHPYRERDYLSAIRLTSKICDGIEVYNATNSDNMNALGYGYAKRLNVPMTAGSDIHFFHDKAMGGMLLPSRISDSSEYASALLSGECTPVRVFEGKYTPVKDISALTVPTHKPSLPVVLY